QAERHHVGLGPAVLFWIPQAEPAVGADTLEEIARKLPALVDRLRLRRHLGVHEARDRAAELLLLGREGNHPRLRPVRNAAVAVSSICSPTMTTPYCSRAASTET